MTKAQLIEMQLKAIEIQDGEDLNLEESWESLMALWAEATEDAPGIQGVFLVSFDPYNQEEPDYRISCFLLPGHRFLLRHDACSENYGIFPIKKMPAGMLQKFISKAVLAFPNAARRQFIQEISEEPREIERPNDKMAADAYHARADLYF